MRTHAGLHTKTSWIFNAVHNSYSLLLRFCPLAPHIMTSIILFCCFSVCVTFLPLASRAIHCVPETFLRATGCSCVFLNGWILFDMLDWNVLRYMNKEGQDSKDFWLVLLIARWFKDALFGSKLGSLYIPQNCKVMATQCQFVGEKNNGNNKGGKKTPIATSWRNCVLLSLNSMTTAVEKVWSNLIFFLFFCCFFRSETRPSRVSAGEGAWRLFKEALCLMELSLFLAASRCLPPCVSHQIQATGFNVLVRG